MYPKHYFTFVIVMFKLAGLFDTNHAKSEFERKFFRAYNVFVFFYCPVYYLTMELLMLYYTSRSSLYEFIDHIGMIFVHVVGTIKMYLSFTNMDMIKNVIRIIKDEKYHYESYGNFKPEKIFMTHCKFTSRITIFYVIMGTMIPLVNQLKATVIFVQMKDELTAGHVTCKQIMPYYSIFPFGSPTLNWCIVEFIVQSIPMVIYVYIIGSFDVCFVFLAAYLRAHFLCIKGAFETLRERCLIRLGLPDDYEIMQDSENPKLEAEIQKEMHKVTKHLQIIIKVFDRLNEFYCIPLLFQSISLIGIFISCLYVISLEPLLSAEAYGRFQYAIVLFIELSLYSFYGCEMTHAALLIPDSIYAVKWYSCTKSIKSTLLINMIRMQRTIVFSLGKFGPLNLATYVQILKGTYTYYTVLSKNG